MFFRFPPDVRWTTEQSAVEFGAGMGEYEGIVRVPRRVFQSLLDESPTPNVASKLITSIALGSNGSPSERSVADN